MCEELKLERFDDSPWGFRLTGGLDFGTPLTVIKVTGGSIAELGGVQVGDLVLEINGNATKHLTHTDAQKCIAASKNHLNMAVMRGSLVTPPDVTPLRGMTPMLTEGERISNIQHELNAELLSERLNQEGVLNGCLECDGLKDPPIVNQTVGVKANMTTSHLTNRESCPDNGETKSENLSDVELAELLTGNEEVLDQGVLGINFQKFIPQVDFIRQSEVFKFLQNENTHKEVPEEIQLKAEPTKRFSTFLMKPKPPPPKPSGPLWHYPKAPRYLPRETEKVKEQPKRRFRKESPPKEDKGHTVLWLFLEEKGEEVIDERWGNEEEERINLSRNEMREEDQVSIASSSKLKSDGRDSRMDNVDIVEGNDKEADEAEKPKHEDPGEIHEINANGEQNDEEDTKEAGIDEKNDRPAVGRQFAKQLAEIQAQIAALEDQAPSDLQTQLLAVQEQLAKIVKQKMLTSYSEEAEEKYVNGKIEDDRLSEENLSNDYADEEKNSQEDFSISSERSREIEIGDECIIENECKLDLEDKSDSERIEHFEEGEYEICEVAPQPQKRPAHPITPQMRPIVLPGGRMWRQPKDAAHEEFYQGILVAQAEVLVGSTEGVNFTKYVPPKFDMSHSAVYRLIQEIEEKTSADKKKIQAMDEYYSEPISKRHFYAATLKEPAPMGDVELKDL